MKAQTKTVDELVKLMALTSPTRGLLRAGVDAGYWNVRTVEGTPVVVTPSGTFTGMRNVLDRFVEWGLAEQVAPPRNVAERFRPTDKAKNVVARLTDE